MGSPESDVTFHVDCFAESLLRVLPGSDLGPWAAGIQVHPVQVTGAQKMPQGSAEAMPEPAAAAAAERGIADDPRQERRPTA